MSSKNQKKFTVTRKPEYKEDKSVNMTLRINRELQKQYDDWAMKTNRSRNELMCMALSYALENIEFIEDPDDSDKEDSDNKNSDKKSDKVTNKELHE